MADPLFLKNRYLAPTSQGNRYALSIGDYLLVASFNAGIYVYQIVGAALNYVFDIRNNPIANYSRLYYDGTYVYAPAVTGGNDDLEAYTFSNGILTFVASLTLADINSVYSDGKYLYITGGTLPGIQLLIYTFDGSSFNFITSDTGSNIRRDVMVKNGYIYVSTFNEGLLAFSFDGTNLNFITSVRSGNTTSFTPYAYSDDIYFSDISSKELYKYSFDGSDFTFLSKVASTSVYSLSMYVYERGVLFNTESNLIALLDHNLSATFAEYESLTANLYPYNLYASNKNVYFLGFEISGGITQVLYVLQVPIEVGRGFVSRLLVVAKNVNSDKVRDYKLRTKRRPTILYEGDVT